MQPWIARGVWQQRVLVWDGVTQPPIAGTFQPRLTLLLKRRKAPVSTVKPSCWVNWWGHRSAGLNCLCLLQEDAFQRYGIEVLRADPASLALMETSQDSTLGLHMNHQDTKTWMEKDLIVAVLILLIFLNAGSAFAVGDVRLVAQVCSSFEILEMGISLVHEALPAGSLCQATPTPQCLSTVHGAFLPHFTAHQKQIFTLNSQDPDSQGKLPHVSQPSLKRNGHIQE